MDYKIKFEYKGIGQKAAATRKQVLQSQKAAKGATSSISNVNTVNILKKLDSSILKLIASNKSLAKALSGGVGTPRGGASGIARGVAGGVAKGGSAGFGKIGAALPIIGAGVAALGFTIQKINQVGNAYIQLASQQIGNVGVGGFRSGRGIYTGAQMGAGAKAFGMATGEFQDEATRKWVRDKSKYRTEAQMQGWGEQAKAEQRRINKRAGRYVTTPNELAKTPRDIGAIFGMSAQETYGMAGKFQRAGANYSQAAAVGAGMGIQTDLPLLLRGMSDIMTESMREGIDTSEMGKGMAKGMASLALQMPGQSMEAALNVIKSSQGVQKQVARGRMGTAEGLYTARASQAMLMERLTAKPTRPGEISYIDKLVSQGRLSQEQATRLRELKPGEQFGELRKAAPQAAAGLLRRFTAEANPVELRRRTMQMMGKEFGADTAEGKQAMFNFMSAQGMTGNEQQWEALLNMRNVTGGGAEARGREMITQRAKGVRESTAGMAVAQTQRREALMMQFGPTFAKTSLQVEKAMLSLAEKAAPSAVRGVELIGTAATSLAGSLDNLAGKINKMSEGGSVSDILGAVFSSK